jgi:uncharacterized protein YxjI
VFDRKAFLVKERVGFLKLSDTYDIFDPSTGAQIGIAREQVGLLLHVLRLLINKRLLPTVVEVRESETGPVLLTIRRSAMSRVTVQSQTGGELGRFKSKLFALRAGFRVFDTSERQVAEIKGDWKGWNFRFLNADGTEIGKVTKQWAGLGKELFTSADNYVIALDERLPMAPDAAALLLAAGLAIDTVYNEN